MKPTKNHITELTNAVRIETLSDDEDVDITDDLSDDDSQTDQPPETDGGQEGVEEQDSQAEASQSPPSPPMPASPSASPAPAPAPAPLAEGHVNGGPVEGDGGESSRVSFDPSVSEEGSKTDFEAASAEGTPQAEEDKNGDPGTSICTPFLWFSVRGQFLIADIS